MNASSLHLPALRAQFWTLIKEPWETCWGGRENWALHVQTNLRGERPPPRINVVYDSYR